MPRKLNSWQTVGEWQFNPDLFERKYYVDPQSLCWQWLGSMGPQGALFGVKKNWEPRMTQARRIAWMKEFNEDIFLYELRHECKNKRCVNPYHMTRHINKQLWRNYQDV